MNNKKKKGSSVLKTVLAAFGCAVMIAVYTVAGMAAAVSILEFDDKGRIIGWHMPYIGESYAVDSSSVLPKSSGQEDDDYDDIQSGIEQEPRFDDKTDESADESSIKDTKVQDNNETADVLEETEEENESTASIEQAQTAPAVVTDVSQVVKAAMPCVVAITSEYMGYDYWYDKMVEEEVNASGIIVGQNDEELLIVTNCHVVENSLNLTVQFIDNSEVTAYVKGTSSESDLAILSVFLDEMADDTLDSIAVAVLGDSDELEVGEPAIAIGNSLGYGQSVTTGVISALNRYIYEEGDLYDQGYLIQTDAAINPGNSGGALLNVRGEVIGINSSKIADSVIEGMGYAIPISSAKPIIDELIQKETRRKVEAGKQGFLGVSGKDVSDSAANDYGMPQGVFVTGVVEDSGAYEAGILKGDIITHFDGEKVNEMTRLQSLLEYYEAGTQVEVTLNRFENGSYEEMTLSVVLGSRE